MGEERFLGWGWPEELKEVCLKAEDLKKQMLDLMQSDFKLHKKVCKKWRHSNCSRSDEVNIQLNFILKEHNRFLLESVRLQRMLPVDSRACDEFLDQMEKGCKVILEEPRNDIPIFFS